MPKTDFTETVYVTGPVGPTGPRGSPTKVLAGRGLTAMHDADRVGISIDYAETARGVLKELGVRPGDRILVERDGEQVALVNPLDMDVVREVIDS